MSLVVPYVVLALGLSGYGFYLWHGWRRGLGRRPVLLVAAALALVPAVYAGLVWSRLVPETFVRFGAPALTPVVPVAMALASLALLRAMGRASALRRHTSDALTATTVLAAALATTSPDVARPLDRLAVIAIVDRSRSIELVPNASERITRELTAAETGMREGDRLGVVVFGANAATEIVPREKSEPRPEQRVEVGRDGTDIAAGIRRALSELPSDSAARIVLVSDGVATRGDALGAAAGAVPAGVRIDVLPLDQRTLPDVRIASLRAPTRASEDETIELRVVTSAPAPARLELRIKRDGVLLRRVEATVAAGEDVLRLREHANEPGLHRYDVEVTALDPSLDPNPEDNSASVFVRVRGPARALVLDGVAGKTAFIASALAQAGFVVDEGTASSVPSDVAAAAAYDLVVFGDIAASDLSPGQITALASYARDLGGGLWLTGGDRSMGPGGYSQTPLEEVSPVSFDLKHEQRRASLAEVIAIDISGSMAMQVGGHTKLELANEAAARSADLLGPGDLLGIAHVDTETNWSVKLGPISDKTAVETAIRAVGPGGGGIYVDVALDAAYGVLDGASVNLKHVLLFADGGDAEQMGASVADAVSRSAKRGITTSVVALGQGHDVPELEQLSRLGGGRFYLVEDATRLPAVFTQETVLASRSAIKEESFTVALGAGSAVTAGVEIDLAPPLEGYVVTIPKPRAAVLLTGPEGDPVLASWQAGIGKTAAFTSDLKDRWGVAWTAWPGAARLVAQLGRHLARRADDAHVRLEALVAGGQLELRATAVDDDGRSQSFRRLRAVVSGPDGFSVDVPLEVAGAGSYEASVPLSRPGAYIALARDELDGAALATTGAVLTLGEELRPTGSDVAALARIAELTRGKKRDTLAGIFADRGERRFAYRNATTSLAAIAAIALLLAVAARRLAEPEWLSRLGARLRRAVAPASHRAEGARGAEGTLGVLLEGRKQARADDLLRRPAARRGAPGPAASDATGRDRSGHAPRTAAGDATEPTGAEALRARRAARDADRTPTTPPREATDAKAPATPSAASPPRAWGKAPTGSGWATPAAGAAHERPRPTTGNPPPSSRTKTAAEILLERRRGRRG